MPAYNSYAVLRHTAINGEVASGRQGGNDEIVIGVGEDFQIKVRNFRKKLIPFLKLSLSEGKEAFLRFDKVSVDGDLYDYCEESKCPIRADI